MTPVVSFLKRNISPENFNELKWLFHRQDSVLSDDTLDSALAEIFDDFSKKIDVPLIIAVDSLSSIKGVQPEAGLFMGRMMLYLFGGSAGGAVTIKELQSSYSGFYGRFSTQIEYTLLQPNPPIQVVEVGFFEETQEHLEGLPSAFTGPAAEQTETESLDAKPYDSLVARPRFAAEQHDDWQKWVTIHDEILVLSSRNQVLLVHVHIPIATAFDRELASEASAWLRTVKLIRDQ